MRRVAGQVRRSGRAALAVRLLAVVAAAELAAGIVAVAIHPVGGVDRSGVGALSHSRPPVAGGPGGIDVARAAAAQRLLDVRAAAVRHHDPVAFAATADPDQPALRVSARRVAADLARVPIGSWSYAVQPAPAAVLPAARRSALGSSAWLADVTLHYTLRGYDTRPAADHLYLTFVERAGHWYVAGDGDGSAKGLRSARELWDFGRVVPVRGTRSLVLGHPGSVGEMRTIAAEADADVPRVTAFWGTAGWSDRVVILVPADRAELEAIVGGQDLSQIAAVATAEIDSTGKAQVATGDRVIVNPANFDQLGALGRQVVLTHEITHVATRPVTGPELPDWLVEGFADYVGFRDSGVSVAVAARELAARLAAGRVPTALPTDGDFGGAAPHLAVAYEEAWLACRYVAGRWGEADLIRLYRAVGTSDEPTESAALRDGLGHVLNVSLAQFTAGWQGYLRQVLS